MAMLTDTTSGGRRRDCSRRNHAPDAACSHEVPTGRRERRRRIREKMYINKTWAWLTLTTTQCASHVFRQKMNTAHKMHTKKNAPHISSEANKTPYVHATPEAGVRHGHMDVDKAHATGRIDAVHRVRERQQELLAEPNRPPARHETRILRKQQATN